MSHAFDIMYAVNQLLMVMSKPCMFHMEVKFLVRYHLPGRQILPLLTLKEC